MAEPPSVVAPRSPGRFWRSLGCALQGVRVLLATQANARIHAVATVAVIAAGFYFEVTGGEWCALVAAMGLVWSAEAFNTALEALVDLVSPGSHPQAGRAKDLAAGAVLCAALAAAVIGALVFLPKLAAVR